MLQDTYTGRQAVAFEGMVGDMTTGDADTRICETEAGIGFGRAVSQGEADRGAVLGGASFVGVTIRDITLPARADVDTHARGENMAVMFRGDIWVRAAADITVGDPVHYATDTGLFSNTGGEGPVGRWITSAASGELGLIRLGSGATGPAGPAGPTGPAGGGS